MTFKLGTRGSPLALVQAHATRDALAQAHGIDPATLSGLAAGEGKTERSEESNVTPFAHPDRDGRDTKPNNDVNA